VEALRGDAFCRVQHSCPGKNLTVKSFLERVTKALPKAYSRNALSSAEESDTAAGKQNFLMLSRNSSQLKRPRDDRMELSGDKQHG